jgi:hypothetical protein
MGSCFEHYADGAKARLVTGVNGEKNSSPLATRLQRVMVTVLPSDDVETLGHFNRDCAQFHSSFKELFN